ncbi:hypothetical protein [Candidatus Venteria ishoeyi]|uniref:Uncharacterized protein n=1 Tax=Candidatus Venteria ishoeyi TaxID=1899563 RepID=A0A1H6FGV3_9GAMM|nr:hypothetical protein [Candidatus Venteria ishoeyi]SEH08893.1 Uncharacterised protein [Candidatus Venteria ishoeyi]
MLRQIESYNLSIEDSINYQSSKEEINALIDHEEYLVKRENAINTISDIPLTPKTRSFFALGNLIILIPPFIKNPEKFLQDISEFIQTIL